jgi:quercetin dioxygenase-like cupin family protein
VEILKRYRPGMEIARNSPESRPGTPEMFTGAVWMDTLAVGGTGDHHVHVLKVRFSPGARTHWHTHPRGQILHISDGVGRIQERGDAVHEIRSGDTVSTGADVWHWHGAGPTSWMTNIAVQEADEHGRGAIWGDPVTDNEYGAPPLG